MSTDPDLDALADAYERGLAAERAGRRSDAIAAYRAALALDPEDRGGVSVRLAALGAGDSPAAAPPAYVATLFDQTARRFEEILVERLGYAVPSMLPDLLDRAGVGRTTRLLDLGCGTGLAAAALAPRTGHVTGCDLSEEMLSIAWDKGLYDDLYVGEAAALMGGWDEAPFDLIVAADMLPYLGDLDPLLAGVTACLAPGGHFAASTETLDPAQFAGRGYMVGPKQRFAHAPAYLAARLDAHRLTPVETREITVRAEDGARVPGQLVLARHDAATG